MLFRSRRATSGALDDSLHAQNTSSLFACGGTTSAVSTEHGGTSDVLIGERENLPKLISTKRRSFLVNQQHSRFISYEMLVFFVFFVASLTNAIQRPYLLVIYSHVRGGNEKICMRLRHSGEPEPF